MPIRQLLDSSAFNPEEVALLCDVFEDMLRALKLVASKRPRHLAHCQEDNRTRAPRRTRSRTFVRRRDEGISRPSTGGIAHAALIAGVGLAGGSRQTPRK